VNLDTIMIGPNDSSLAMNISSVTSVKMVGYKKKPATSQQHLMPARHSKSN